MTTQTATLTEFLLARIAEDEAAARQQAALLNSGAVFDMHTAWDVGPGDPARVLAECDAKRTLLNDATLNYGLRTSGEPSIFHERVLRIMAAPYADHPDFREEWRA